MTIKSKKEGKDIFYISMGWVLLVFGVVSMASEVDSLAPIFAFLMANNCFSSATLAEISRKLDD